MSIEAVRGGGSGWAGLEAYYSDKIDSIEFEKLQESARLFQSVATDIATSGGDDGGTSLTLPAPSSGVGAPLGTSASLSLEQGAMEMLRTQP